MTFVKWGVNQILIQAPVAAALNAAHGTLRDLLWRSAVSGKSNAAVHAGTHSDGWAIDFSLKTSGWSHGAAHEVKDFLSVNFAIAFRVGVSEHSTGNHLHAAFRGHSNSAAILAANENDPWRNAHAISTLWPQLPRQKALSPTTGGSCA